MTTSLTYVARCVRRGEMVSTKWREILLRAVELKRTGHHLRNGPSTHCARRRIASAASVASFEDLGVQMNRHSTLVSYLHKLLMLLTGNFGKKGSAFIPTMMAPFTVGHEGGAGTEVISSDDRQGVEVKKGTPVTGSRLIGGLTPCNVIPDENPDRSSQAISRDAR